MWWLEYKWNGKIAHVRLPSVAPKRRLFKLSIMKNRRTWFVIIINLNWNRLDGSHMKYAVNCKLGAKFNVTGDLQTKTADTEMIFCFIQTDSSLDLLQRSKNLIESKRMFILPEWGVHCTGETCKRHRQFLPLERKILCLSEWSPEWEWV